MCVGIVGVKEEKKSFLTPEREGGGREGERGGEMWAGLCLRLGRKRTPFCSAPSEERREKRGEKEIGFCYLSSQRTTILIGRGGRAFYQLA